MFEITQEELKELFYYDPVSGIFTYTRNRGTRVKKGAVAGWATTKGYLTIKYKNSTYQLHRLAFLYMTGIFLKDKEIVDHINGIVTDNRWENLRIASNVTNSHNRRLSSANSTGVKGVYYNKQLNKYQAAITTNGITTNVGLFNSLHDAEQAIIYIREKKHKEFANHGK